MIDCYMGERDIIGNNTRKCNKRNKTLYWLNRKVFMFIGLSTITKLK